MEGAAATVPPQRPGPKAMRGIARFCINTFRVFYARAAFARPAPVPLPSSSLTTAAAAATATFSHRQHRPLAEEEPSFEAMGNLQSDARRRGRKGKGGASTASSEDGLEDVEAEDGGGEAEEETVGRKQEQEGSRQAGVCVEKRLTQKRQAPKPPASAAERKVF